MIEKNRVIIYQFINCQLSSLLKSSAASLQFILKNTTNSIHMARLLDHSMQETNYY